MKMFRLLGSLIGAAFFAFPIIWLAGLFGDDDYGGGWE
jgi:hypothetical protein|tara:strand:+ start:7581 stop:7694 length:114 start_codon:yes stop_codon:yes gene_type:complete